MAYDPKRPRPAQAAADEPPPVNALLDAPPQPDDQRDRVSEAQPERGSGTPQAPRSTGPASSRTTEVPVAPAPEVGTTNRAVLYAALVVAALVAAAVVGLRLRSRRSS